MPSSFTIGRANLTTEGPIVDLLLVVGKGAEDALKRDGNSVPEPLKIIAMIDTGASGTVIQEGLAAKLGLTPIGKEKISTPSSTGLECFVYDVRLVFPNNTGVEGVRAIEAPLKDQNIQCLVGRDVLSQGVLVYTGYLNQFTLSF